MEPIPPSVPTRCHICYAKFDVERSTTLRAYVYRHPGFSPLPDANYGDAPHEVVISDRRLQRLASIDLLLAKQELFDIRVAFRNRMSNLHNDVLADSLPAAEFQSL